MSLHEFFLVSAVLFVASAFRTAFGFGEALIAVPLLSFLLPVRVASPLAVLASIVIATAVLLRDWRHVHFEAARNLLLATLAGLPFGLALLRYAPERTVKILLGVLLLLFSAFSLHRPKAFRLRDDRLVWLFGFLAGVTGGSYGMNGPPLAIYGAGRGWEPSRFRATIQAYFLPASVLGMAGYFFSGLWTTQVSTLFAYSLPAVAAGMLTGRAIATAIDGRGFAQFLYGALTVIAVVLLYSAI